LIITILQMISTRLHKFARIEIKFEFKFKLETKIINIYIYLIVTIVGQFLGRKPGALPKIARPTRARGSSHGRWRPTAARVPAMEV
jgi:hypothetical protein